MDVLVVSAKSDFCELDFEIFKNFVMLLVQYRWFTHSPRCTCYTSTQSTPHVSPIPHHIKSGLYRTVATSHTHQLAQSYDPGESCLFL